MRFGAETAELTSSPPNHRPLHPKPLRRHHNVALLDRRAGACRPARVLGRGCARRRGQGGEGALALQFEARARARAGKNPQVACCAVAHRTARASWVLPAQGCLLRGRTAHVLSLATANNNCAAQPSETHTTRTRTAPSTGRMLKQLRIVTPTPLRPFAGPRVTTIGPLGVSSSVTRAVRCSPRPALLSRQDGCLRPLLLFLPAARMHGGFCRFVRPHLRCPAARPPPPPPPPNPHLNAPQPYPTHMHTDPPEPLCRPGHHDQLRGAVWRRQRDAPHVGPLIIADMS